MGSLDILKILLETNPNFIMMKDELIKIANVNNSKDILEFLENIDQ